MNNFRNMFLGVCEITDGFIRLVTLGFIHTTFAFNWLVWWEANVVLPAERKRLRNER